VTVSDTVVAVQCFAACVSNVNDWMRTSRLRLNPAKTEVMWIGSYQQLKHVDIDDIPILSMQVKVAETSRDLGSCPRQPAVTIVTCCCALSSWILSSPTTIRPAVRSMITTAAKTVVQAFICCRLDYCNSMLYGMSDGIC